MPVLNILDDDGRLLGSRRAGLTVFATMLHPSDPELRAGYIAAVYQASLQSDETTQSIPAEIGKLTFEQGGSPGIMNGGLSAFSAALMAGETLIRVLQLANRAPEHASVRKAQYMVMRYRVATGVSKGKPVTGSHSSIETAWSRFKPVAHLWGAFIPLWIDKDGDEHVFYDGRLPELLSNARHLALSAVRFHPPGMGSRTRPVLDPAKIWAIPESPDIPTVALEPPPLSEAERNWLDEYFHK